VFVASFCSCNSNYGKWKSANISNIY